MSSIEDIPFWARVAALISLMAAMAGLELARYGKSATRWREYTFILGAGVAAGLLGSMNDLLTSSISPDYFILGKGLPADNLWRNAAALGLQAGFSAGVVAGALCVYAATRTSAHPPLVLDKLILFAWRPLALAVGLAALFLGLLSGLDPMDITTTFTPLLESPQISLLLKVWWIHCGLYAGLIAGVAWIVADVTRQRRCSTVAREP